MKNIFLIAKNTFRETIRDRILYGVLAFAIIFIVILFFLSDASLGEERRVFTSVGLGGIYLFGTCITIFLSAAMIAKELDKKTLYFVVPRAVSREQVIVGKFMGLLASVALSIFILSLAYFAALSARAWFAWENILALALQILESALLVGIIIFLSTFLRPMLAVLASIVVLYAGHSMTTLAAMAERMSPSLGDLALLFSYVFPNLEKFNMRNDVIYGFPVPSAEIVFAFLYAAFGTALALLLASLVFKKKEL